MASCLSKKNAEIPTKESAKLSQVVLIFKNFPEDYSIYLDDTRKEAYTPARPELRYYDDHLIQRIIKPKREIPDTLVIPCNQNVIEFQHSVRGMDNFEYLFQKGDTVIFSYTEKIPLVKITNRTVSDFQINYDLRHREIICNNDYPAIIKVMVPYAFIKWNSNYIGQEGEQSGISGQIDRVKSNGNLRFNKELELEKAFLDSLYKVNLVTQEVYIWLNQRLNIKENTIKAYNDNLKPDQVKSIIPEKSDSLLKYHSYRNLITQINSSYYERKGKRIIKSNSNLPDYNIVYDSILKSNFFSRKTKDILLFETSGSLVMNSNTTEISNHLTKMKSDINDTIYLTNLVDTYKLKKPVSKELELVGLKGNKLMLSQFIDENKGKVIYIDIWASWCRPCIEEFPKSKKLAEELKNKDIQFIYLSIDDEMDKWINSSNKHGLPDRYSFIVDNKRVSKFLEELDFNTIPRYLIISKAGKLEYKNAPRPSDQRLIKILTELLTK